MNRSIFSTIARALITWVTLVTWLLPSVVWAGTPYTIHWWLSEENPACEAATIIYDGHPFFSVNGTPVPTFEVPGARQMFFGGPDTNQFDAGFNSVLLRTGQNGVGFSIRNASDDDTCVHEHNVVTLLAPTIGVKKPLFNVRRDGTAFSGSAHVEMTLAEINPPLARDIVNLEHAIAAERAELLANASKTGDLAARQSALQALDTELHDLVNRPLDEITVEDLDAILKRYASVVDPATLSALEQLLVDLKKSVADLEAELQSLLANFGEQAASVTNLVTESARQAGFDPDDPTNYALGDWQIPGVAVPDVGSVPGAFDPGSDPYAAYADAVIAELAKHVSGKEVVERREFAIAVRAWRSNGAAIEQALAMRSGVSQAETSAFLNAENRVVAYVRQFMDAQDWFTDSPVPADLRATVDGSLQHAFGPLDDEPKDSLNGWQGETLNLEQTQAYQTILAFGAAIEAVGDGFAAYAQVMQTLVTATSRIAVGFIPYVGPALDLCECITGKSWCLPSGKDLSNEERVFSGIGFAVGAVGPTWGKVKNAGVSPTAKVAAAELEQFGEELALAIRANRRTWYKTLRGAVSPVTDPFERKAALYLLKDEQRALIGVGDDGVRKVLGIPKTSPVGTELGRAPDFLSMTKGNKLVLSEVKGGGKVALTGKSGAIGQLTNAMNKVKEIGFEADVSAVEVVIQKGAELETNYAVKNGLLINILENKTVHIENFPLLFIRIVKL
jgi:hypothetical protein